MVIPASFWSAQPFSEGLAAVQAGDADGRLRYGYIDKTGRMAIAPQFTAAAKFSQGRAAVQLDSSGLYGYIDRAGAVVIQPAFYKAGDFMSGGVAEVQLTVKQTVTAAPGHSTEVFQPVSPDGENSHRYYIDTTGRVIWPPEE